MTKLWCTNPLNEDDLQWKTTSNIKNGISQHPLIGSYSNFKLQLRWPNHIFKSSKWRRPQILNDLKILKVEYSSLYDIFWSEQHWASYSVCIWVLSGGGDVCRWLWRHVRQKISRARTPIGVSINFLLSFFLSSSSFSHRPFPEGVVGVVDNEKCLKWPEIAR